MSFLPPLDEKEEQFDEYVGAAGGDPKKVRVAVGGSALAVVLGLVLWAIASMTCGAASSGCTPANSPTQADARAAAIAVATALGAAKTACAAAVHATSPGPQKEGLRAHCEAVLNPLEDLDRQAADGADAWGDAGAADFPCTLARAVAGLALVSDFLKSIGVGEPAAIAQAVTAIAAFTPSCSADGGA